MTNEEIKEALKAGTLKPEITPKGRYLLGRYDELIASGMGEQEAIDAAQREADEEWGG